MKGGCWSRDVSGRSIDRVFDFGYLVLDRHLEWDWIC